MSNTSSVSGSATHISSIIPPTILTTIPTIPIYSPSLEKAIMTSLGLLLLEPTPLHLYLL